VAVRSLRGRNFSGSALQYLGFKTPFLPDLRIHANGGMDLSTGKQTTDIGPYSFSNNYYGSYGFEKIDKYNLSFNSYLQYMKAVGIHNFDVMAGITTTYDLMENIKVIVLVSEGIFFDEEKFLTDFEGMLAGQDGDPGLAFFAEQFGYRRFCMAYETDDPLQLRISRLLYEMEFAETRQMVGPSPEVSFPPFFGLVPVE